MDDVIRKTLTILSFVGLMLCIVSWVVSLAGGYRYTGSYRNDDGSESVVTLVCGEGRLGWHDEAKSLSSLPPGQSISLWLLTAVFVGGMLFVKWKAIVVASPVLLVLCLVLWGMSYWTFYFNNSTFGTIYLASGVLVKSSFDKQRATGLACWGFRDWETNWTGRTMVNTAAKRWTGGTSRVQYIFSPSMVLIPLWIPAAVLAVLAVGVKPGWRRRRRGKLGLCVQCGYDLRGSSERCPECGTGFEAKVEQP